LVECAIQNRAFGRSRAFAVRMKKYICAAVVASLVSLLGWASHVDAERVALNCQLIDAIHHDDLREVIASLGRGADLNAREDGSRLYSVFEDDPSTVSQIERGRRWLGLAPHNLGPTALMLAIDFKERRLVRELLTRGADVNARDAVGSVLRHAEMSGNEMAQMLREAGVRR
jgi:hypothetical protein